MAYKTGNPALNKEAFKDLERTNSSEVMTLNGVVHKSFLMIVMAIFAGYLGWQWSQSFGAGPSGASLIFLSVTTFIVAVVTIFKKTWAPVTAPIYALAEGFLLGAVSQFYEARFEGIVLQAIMLTGGIFMAMLIAYRSGLIKATENFKLGLFAATGGILLYYLANFVIGLFGRDLPLVNSDSPYGIAFTVFVIIVAALNLVLDFDFIEEGVENKSPKYMEWYSSFGLFVTLVWLYIEILRLLGKTRD